MSIQSRKDRQKQELRHKIFDTATSIILEEGYEKLSMRKLAERIEYSPTIIYHYFKDKADIVNQIILETYRTSVNSVAEVVDTYNDQPVDVRFHHAVVCFITTMTANAPQFRAVLLSGGDMTTPDPERGEAGLNMIEDLLQEGVREGIFHQITPYTSQIIISALFGLVFHLIGHKIEDPDKIEEMAKECVDILLTGCRRKQEEVG